MSVPLLSKLDEWTVEDLVALPDDGRRYEIVDGSLVVSPAPGIRHEVVVEAVKQVLRPAVPPGLRLLGTINVAFGRNVRIPDVVVVREELVSRDVLAASPADVVLAVEVVSPSSVTTDRVTKPTQYASVGIDHYWRVEPAEGPSLAVYERVGDAYVERGTWHGGEEAVLERPFPVRLVPADLLA